MPADAGARNAAPRAARRAPRAAGGGEVYNMDVMDFLESKVADNSVDLAVIDPPYNMNKAAWDHFASHGRFLDFTFAWILGLLPKLNENSSLYIFNTPFNSAYILQFLVEHNMDFKNWIVWDKQDGVSAPKNKFVNGAETILFFTKGKPVFNYDAIREPYKCAGRMAHAATKGILKNGKRWFPNPDGRLCSEVWSFSSQRHKSKQNGKVRKMPHLTPKPLDMIERIVRASSAPDALVLDCFMGSGTTALACQNLGRRFVGCEADSQYHELCLDNIRKNQKSPQRSR